MQAYSLEFSDEWERRFQLLDKGVRARVWKKIQQLKGPVPARHLKEGANFFVSEVGQYRIAYKTDEKRRAKTIFFVGDHKEYEKWLGQ